MSATVPNQTVHSRIVSDTTVPEQPLTPTDGQGLPEAWVFQPSIKHYRLPVWDLLAERAAGRYQLKVLGPLDIEPDEIACRPYLQALPLKRRLLFGRELAHWRGAAKLIRQGQPAVVVLTATVAFVSSWTLPRVARRLGAAVIGWSKINSRAGRTRALERRVKRAFFKRFDRFLCYGQQSKRELVSLGYPADKIAVAQNTIDTRIIFETFAALVERGGQLRAAAGLENKKIVLCIGRMAPQKRQADVISAWLDVRDTDPDLTLVMVGGGPLLEGLQTAADEIDPARIFFTGRVATGDDYAWIATADLVVIPGAVGLALNQAMASGKPIVMADEPGADAELLVDGATGWRYPRGDIQALARTMGEALSNRAEAESRGRRASERIRELATVERMVQTLDETIVEGIELSRQRRSRQTIRS